MTGYDPRPRHLRILDAIGDAAEWFLLVLPILMVVGSLAVALVLELLK